MKSVPADLIASTAKEGPFRPGTYYRNGRLFIVTSISVLVLSRWPGLLAWRYHAKFHSDSPHYRCTETAGAKRFGWRNVERHSDPDQSEFSAKFDQLVRGEGWNRLTEQAEIDAVRAYLAPIPKSVLARAAAYDERSYWKILRLLSHPWGLELAISNAALAFALANHVQGGLRGVRWPHREAIAQLHRSQHGVVDWLQLPGGRRTVRILRKIPPSTLILYFIPLLRCALVNETVSEWLVHLPKVTEQVLWLVTEPSIAPLLSSALLHDVVLCEGGSQESREAASEVFRSLLFLRQHLKPPRKFRSVRGVIKAARKVSRAMPVTPDPRDKPLLDDGRPYPPAPFAGTNEIRAITSAADLVREAAEMGHCIRRYHDQVREGRCYVYKVLAPERATLTVVKRKGQWYFEEIWLAHNVTPNSATVCAVYKWLSNSQPPRSGS